VLPLDLIVERPRIRDAAQAPWGRGLIPLYGDRLGFGWTCG
jgi:hypothetical protein